MSRPIDPRLVRRVPAMRPYLAALGVLRLLSGVLIVAQAVLLASIIVAVFDQHQFGHALLIRLLALAGVGLGRAAIDGAQEFVSARASLTVRAQLRQLTLKAVVGLGPFWAQRQPAGRLSNATGPGLDALDGYMTRALPAALGSAVVPGIVLTWIAVTDWQSGLLLLVMLPLVPLFMALVGVTTKRRVQRQYLLLSRLAGHFLDLLQGLSTLKIYGQAARQERTLHEATQQYRRQTMAALRIAFLSALVLDLVAALSVAVVAVDVGLRLDGGSLSFASALVVLLLAPEVFAPLRAFGAQYHASQEGATAAAAALDVLDEYSAHRSSSRTEAGPSQLATTGTIALDGVRIQHPGRSEPALQDVYLTVQTGELVALSGASGAGKSTLLSALLGFVAPDSGEIMVGIGQQLLELHTVDADSWRRNLAWLPQLPVPSQADVGSEVGLGDSEAGEDAIAEVCRECSTPPPDTALGEDGRWVSAGQRRRIALARVLLRARAVRRNGGVPVVLLDEPSEDLDRDTERLVARVIVALSAWATVIVATHSPLLTSLATRKITLADGRVIDNCRQIPAELDPSVALPGAGSIQRNRPTKQVDSIDQSPTPPALRLWELARSDGVRRPLLIAGLLAALAGLSGLGLTATSTWLISRAAQHPNVQALAIAVVGVRAFAIARALLRYAERLTAHDAALRLLAGLRVRVFAALRPLSPSTLGGYGRGDLLRRFVGDVDGVQDGLVRAFIPLSGAVVTALGATAVATYLAPAAGVALAAGLVLAMAIPWLAARAAGDCTRLVELVGQRDARTTGTLDALPELIAYGAAYPALTELERLEDEVARSNQRPAIAGSVGVLLSNATAAIALPMVLFFGAEAVRNQHLGAVSLAVLAVCALVGFDAVGPLPAAFAAWARCRAGLARVAAVLAAPHAFAEPPAGLPRHAASIGIRATSLDLAPAPAAPPVLVDVDLRVRPGQRVALIGPSGCGKSTLLAAVLRLIPINGGRLDLDTDDGPVAVSSLRAEEVPPLVAGSLQGDHVFDATLRDNLRVVKPAASDAELDQVARRAGLGGFVATLPRGWSTPAGPDGAALSGGQRQRLLLARAFLADPDVLVLDEPTAHLDLATEQSVLRDLLDATTGRTVLISTHRALRPGQVDAVLQIDLGEVRASGAVALQRG
jgi:ATP-binding cassette subfamily C protein CydCD